jgi:hypothetical protein
MGYFATLEEQGCNRAQPITASGYAGIIFADVAKADKWNLHNIRVSYILEKNANLEKMDILTVTGSM